MSSRNHHSLSRQLFISLSLPMLLLLLLAAAASIWVASKSVNKLYDQQMKNNADVLSAFFHFEVNERRFDDNERDDEEGEHEGEEEEYEDDEESYEVSDELIKMVNDIESQQGIAINYRLKLAGRTIFTSMLVRNLPKCAQGFSNFQYQDRDDIQIDWRCFRQAHYIEDSNLRIVTEYFEPVAIRKQAIKSLILSSYLPMFLVPVLVLIITFWAVRRGMAELEELSGSVKRRSVDNLEQISREGKSVEMLPIVDSVNKLLNRLDSGFSREKRFTDDAAHELRTPVTSIKMLEQLLRRDNKDPQLNQNLDQLRDAAMQCQSLIDQLLRMARLQARRSLNREILSLPELINEQLSLLSPQLTAKHMSVELDVRDPNPTIDADKNALVLLLNNLLSNAVKFNDENKSIYITIADQTLTVEDDGPGISAEDQGRVFDRFFRASATRQTSGNGLGLSLARWVASMHGFELSTLNPSVGSGAAFKLDYRQV